MKCGSKFVRHSTEIIRQSKIKGPLIFNKYLLIAQPIYKPLAFSDLADLAVYGVLSAIEGCDAFQDLLNNTKVAKWYNRVKEACRLHKGQSIFTEQDKVMDWYDCK